MHTVIGVFDDMPHAQLAREQLHQQLRIAQPQMHLGAGHIGPNGELVNDSTAERRRWENRSVLAAYGSFWASLIESNVHAPALDVAMQRGHVVLAVQLDDAGRAGQVTQILAQCQAIEVQHGDAAAVGTAREPQPWHAADERAQGRPRGAARGAARGEPIGTHSFAGHGATVGLPTGRSEAARDRTAPAAERSAAASSADERAAMPDLLADRPDANRER